MQDGVSKENQYEMKEIDITFDLNTFERLYHEVVRTLRRISTCRRILHILDIKKPGKAIGQLKQLRDIMTSLVTDEKELIDAKEKNPEELKMAFREGSYEENRDVDWVVAQLRSIKKISEKIRSDVEKLEIKNETAKRAQSAMLALLIQ